MIPRTARRGHSFNGAGLYYLHDKKAMTTDRVDWTHTHNLSTDDPEKAMKRMAYTSMNAEKLKHENGVDKRGRKSTAGHVYSFSLAWHPEQTPDKDHMIETSLTLLERLGLKDNHQAVLVAHNDEAHSHVHVICNLINRENGKTASTSNDRLIMSKWAEEYELEHGKIYCDTRVENNQKRKELSQDDAKDKRQKEQQDFKDGNSKKKPETGIVKHRQSKHERSELIQNLYHQSDSGKAFRAALEEEGFTLARGDRRGFVLVDDSGKIHSLSRQLKGQRAKDLRNRLADIEDLKSPKEIANDKQSFDRDQANIDQQNKELDAADEHGRETAEQENKQERKQKAKRPSKEFEKPKREGNKKDVPKSKEKSDEPLSNKPVEKDGLQLAEEQSKKWDRIIEYDRGAEILRSKLNAKLEKVYNRNEVAKEADELRSKLSEKQGLLSKIKGRRKAMEERLLELDDSLRQIDERIKNENGKLDKQIEQDRPVEANDNSQEIKPSEPNPEMIDKLERMKARKRNQRSKGLDKGGHKI